MTKKILYIDMDWVLVDFMSGVRNLPEEITKNYNFTTYKNIPGIFWKMHPMPGAIEAFNELYEVFDVYFLSTAPWENDSAWSDKLKWVKKYFWEKAKKRLILSHKKHLNKWDFLVDDRLANWSDKFEWEMIHFGQKWFENWEKVKKYLMTKK